MELEVPARYELDFLNSSLESHHLSLLETNYLARLLSSLDEEGVQTLEALVSMETEQNDEVSVERLISLVQTVPDVVKAPGVTCDYELGKWLVENEILSELEGIPDAVIELLDFERIGERDREAMHGVYVGDSYYEFPDWPEVNQEYDPSKLPVLMGLLPKSTLTVDFDCYDTSGGEAAGRDIRVEFPISVEEYDRVLETLHCTEHTLLAKPVFCYTPSLMDANWAVGIDTLNSYAELTRQFLYNGTLPLYKAVLEAHRCDDLNEAVKLAGRIDEYRLRDDFASPIEYARAALGQKLGTAEADLLSSQPNIVKYARDLLTQDNIESTSYGFLQRIDEAPIHSSDMKQGVEMEQSM